MGKPNPQNLKPCTPENARERQLKSAQKRKENNVMKKIMEQIYVEFLEEEFEIKEGETKRKISGAEYCKLIAKTVLKRADSSSVAMLKEIREAIEGSKINLSGTVKTEMETTEDRIRAFENIVGKKC